jgi:PAS domain S-box-containing protein
MPIEILDSHPYCFEYAIRRNYQIMQKQYRDQKLIRTLVQLIPNSVTLFDLKGNIIFSNARIIDASSESIIGKSVFSFLKRGHRKLIKNYMHTALHDNKSVTFQSEIKTKKGKFTPVAINAKLINDFSGAPLYYLAILTDISIQKEIKRKEKYLSYFIETTKDGIIALDRNGNITLWNKGDEEIFGYPESEVLGKNICSLCPNEEINQSLKEILFKVKSEGFVQNYICRNMKKSGENLDLNYTLTALKDDDGNFIGTFAIIRDISNVKLTLDNVQKKNEEMEHLINVVSHDLRSPLHAIDNYLSFIDESIRESVQDESVYEMMERIHANINNMESLIKDLADFSKAGVESGEEIAVDLNSLVNDIISNIQWQFGKSNFLVEMDKLPTIRIDPRRIHQIFENLLSNAYKFRKEGKPATTEIRVLYRNENIEFLISDTGIGVSKQHHDRIFDLFYRAKEKTADGSGAGLAITRKIINTQGGEIWLDSKESSGTTFCFTLPTSLLVDEEN